MVAVAAKTCRCGHLASKEYFLVPVERIRGTAYAFCRGFTIPLVESTVHLRTKRLRICVELGRLGNIIFATSIDFFNEEKLPSSKTMLKILSGQG